MGRNLGPNAAGQLHPFAAGFLHTCFGAGWGDSSADSGSGASAASLAGSWPAGKARFGNSVALAGSPGKQANAKPPGPGTIVACTTVSAVARTSPVVVRYSTELELATARCAATGSPKP